MCTLQICNQNSTGPEACIPQVAEHAIIQLHRKLSPLVVATTPLWVQDEELTHALLPPAASKI